MFFFQRAIDLSLHTSEKQVTKQYNSMDLVDISYIKILKLGVEIERNFSNVKLPISPPPLPEVGITATVSQY